MNEAVSVPRALLEKVQEALKHLVLVREGQRSTRFWVQCAQCEASIPALSDLQALMGEPAKASEGGE